jgi:hypothetical protein
MTGCDISRHFGEGQSCAMRPSPSFCSGLRQNDGPESNLIRFAIDYLSSGTWIKLAQRKVISCNTKSIGFWGKPRMTGKDATCNCVSMTRKDATCNCVLMRHPDNKKTPQLLRSLIV